MFGVFAIHASAAWHVATGSRSLILGLVRSLSLTVKTRVLILVALLVIPLFCAASFLREIVAADSALDSGASFDYVTATADRTRNHPYISFSERHRLLLVASAISFAGAVIYVFYITSGRLGRRAI